MAFTVSINFTNAQWVQTSEPYNSSPFKSIAVNGANIFAGSQGGGLFLSADTGTTWTAVNSFPDTYINVLTAYGTNIYAGTANSGLLLSTDTGTTWMVITHLLPNSVISLVVIGPNIIAGTYFGGVFLSTDMGAHWKKQINSFSSGVVFSLANDGTNIFAGVGNPEGVFLSSDSGASWSASGLTSNNIFSLAVSGTNIFAGTDSGVFLSADTGKTWTAVNNGLPNRAVFSLAITGTNIFAGTSGGIFVSTNKGSNWTAINQGFTGLTDTTILSLAISGTNIFAGTNSAGVWESDLANILQYIVECVPSVAVSGSTSFCQGGSVTLTARDSTGSGYLWSDGETTNSISVTTTGNYSCNVTSACGIVNTNTIVVTANPLPVATITPSGNSLSLCQGSILDASGGSSYLWSNGATTPSITVSTPQIDSVTITDANGCSATSSATDVTTVYPSPTPVITPGGATSVCDGDSVVLTSSAATSYNWINGATTQSITVKSTGSYEVTVTYANGCSPSSLNTLVIIHSNPLVPTIHQIGNSLKSSYPSGNQWYLNGNIISGATGQFYVVTQNGIYTVQYTNSNGCSSTSASFNFTTIGVGITELTSDNSFSIYPNPVGNQLTVVIANRARAGKQSLIIEIYNILGEKAPFAYVQGDASSQAERSRSLIIDVSTLPAGIYFIQMKTEIGIDTKRFVKE